MQDQLFMLPLEKLFRNSPVKVCYLFGSQASLKSNMESDYDIAVFVNNIETTDTEALHKSIASSFLHPEKLHISIVDLANTSPLFLFQIIKHGKILYEKASGYHYGLESLIMRLFFKDQSRTEVFYQAMKQKYVNR